jgi:hypothetical protein
MNASPRATTIAPPWPGKCAGTTAARRREAGKHPFSRHRGGREVLVERARIRRSMQLDRAVRKVSDEHRGLTRVQPQHRRSRGVSGCGPKVKRLAELMVVGPQLDLVFDRKHAVLEHESPTGLSRGVGLGAWGPPLGGVIRVEVAVVGLGHDVPGIGKRRHP